MGEILGMLSYVEREKLAYEFITTYNGDISKLFDRMSTDISNSKRGSEHYHEWLGQLILNVLYRMYANALNDPEFNKSVTFADYSECLMTQIVGMLKKYERTSRLINTLVPNG